MSPSTQPQESGRPRLSDAVHAQVCSSMALTPARRKSTLWSDRTFDDQEKSPKEVDVRRQLISASYFALLKRVRVGIY